MYVEYSIYSSNKLETINKVTVTLELHILPYRWEIRGSSTE